MSIVRELLHRPEFPRSSQYDPDWILDGQMGPRKGAFCPQCLPV